mgnify:CR=1 FL=1
MNKKSKNSKFTITKRISPTPMTQAEWEASEELLAEMIARAIAADHPEWFGGGERIA